MMFILDTNVVFELRKVQAGKADPNVAAWAESVDAADLFVSVITIMELELGVLSIERKDGSQGAILRAWLEQSVSQSYPAKLYPLIQRLRSAVLVFMCQTNVVNAMHSSQPPHRFMA